MKKIILLFFLVCCNVTFSQTGKLYLKNSKVIIGKDNTYVYEIPKGLEISKDAKVAVIYNNNFDFNGSVTSLKKKSKSYEFALKVPDSIKYFVAVIIDNKKVVDNNDNQGYDVFLNSSSPKNLAKCMVERIQLITYTNKLLTSRFNLKLDSTPESIIQEYDKLYATYPVMKEDKSYESYLYMKEPFDKEQTKAESLNFAQKCEKKDAEDYLIIASNIYGKLEMNDKKKEIEDKISAKYPNGQFEMSKCFFDFIGNPDKTEAYTLEFLNLFTNRFKDIHADYKDYLYQNLLKIYVTNKDFQKIDQYENMLPNKNRTAYLYNNYAWDLSGEDLVTPVKDLDYLEKISKRAIDILAVLEKESDFPDELNRSFNLYADTYALLLYKQNRFEEAFQYEDKVNQLGGLDKGGKERYAVMLEKVKGAEVAKKYIEEELSKGTNSKVLFTQLETIYAQLNLPTDNLKAIKSKSTEAANVIAKADIVKRYGTAEAVKFNLKNLEGKAIDLSDYKGKVVILDFWATWCGPCKASFPAMQELVTKYKDKDVAFLFMNTWERGKENEVVEKVKTFINDKKYNFNVVFDFDSAITSKYKVEGIPTKILIDKNGSVISFGSSEQDLIQQIDEQLSL